jgi:hypothetical protein
MKTRIQEMKEVHLHKLAFLKVRKDNPVLKANISIFRALLHDTGKMLNILLLGDNLATKIHRKLAGHHNCVSRSQLFEAICDWECARITKPSKPLDGRATWLKYYQHLPCQDLLDAAGL